MSTFVPKNVTPKYSDLNLLDDVEALEVVKAVLQLNVRHKCGTAHSYSLEFDVTDERGIEHQLNEDLSVLVSLMQERVHEGELRVNDRVYLATEVSSLKDPMLDNLLNKFPVMVMAPVTKTVSVAVPEDAKSEETIVYPDIQSEAKPQKARRRKNERVEAGAEDGEGAGEGRQHDVRKDKGSDEQAAETD